MALLKYSQVKGGPDKNFISFNKIHDLNNSSPLISVSNISYDLQYVCYLSIKYNILFDSCICLFRDKAVFFFFVFLFSWFFFFFFVCVCGGGGGGGGRQAE